MISFLVAGYIGDFFEFVGLKRITRLCWKIMLYDIVSGFKVFFVLEPDAARAIMKKIEEFYTNFKLFEITGINSFQD